MASDVATKLYGQLSGKVDTLTNLPLAINIAFATALVPAISAANAKNMSQLLSLVYTISRNLSSPFFKKFSRYKKSLATSSKGFDCI